MIQKMDKARSWFAECFKQVNWMDWNILNVLTFVVGTLFFGTLLTVIEGLSITDGVFMVTSALCVTGLSSVDFSQFTPAGQILIALCIQMGGLGIVTFTLLAGSYIVTGLSKRESVAALLTSAFETDDHKSARYMLFSVILRYTLLFEGGGTLIMGAWLQWVNTTTLSPGQNPWTWAFFHSISAFNNAGFGMESDNLMKFAGDPVINGVIGGLIIAGGIGYTVILAAHVWVLRRLGNGDNYQQLFEKLVASPVQIIIARRGTVLLLAVGTFVPLVIEWNNPMFKDFNTFSMLLATWFNTGVSPRTAGFNTIDFSQLHPTTLWLTIALMFIGANPGGTAGGIKIPTMYVLWGYLRNWHREPGAHVIVAHHMVSGRTAKNAINLFFFSVIWVGIATFLVTGAEEWRMAEDPRINPLALQFEVVSAFGTVGLSLGHPSVPYSLSGVLSTFSKWVIILTMLIGRLGPLTWLGLWPWPHNETAEGEDADLDPEAPREPEKLQIG